MRSLPRVRFPLNQNILQNTEYQGIHKNKKKGQRTTDTEQTGISIKEIQMRK